MIDLQYPDILLIDSVKSLWLNFFYAIDIAVCFYQRQRFHRRYDHAIGRKNWNYLTLNHHGCWPDVVIFRIDGTDKQFRKYPGHDC